MSNERNDTASLVTHYLQARAEEMAQVHPAWAVESRFNDSKLKYEPKSKHEYVRLLKAGQLFETVKLTTSREFMEALQAYGMLERHKLPFNPIDCSWKEVLEELHEAEKAAVASQQGDKNFLTKGRRRLSTMSNKLPLLDLIPKELGTLRGGFAVVFHVCGSEYPLSSGADESVVACSK